MLAERHHETVLSSSLSPSFVLRLAPQGISGDVMTTTIKNEDAEFSGVPVERGLMSLVWKRGWMVIVLIEIGLREISQRDAGEVAGETIGEQVSSERRPRIRLGLPDG